MRLGEHRISTKRDCLNENDPKTCNMDEPPIQDIGVDRWIVHEKFAESDVNDIALIRLKTAANFVGKKSVGTICLPVRYNQTVDAILKEEDADLRLTVAGWGYSEVDLTKISDVLRFVHLSYVPNEECNQPSKNLMVWIHFRGLDSKNHR